MKIKNLKKKYGVFRFYAGVILLLGFFAYAGFKLGNEHYEVQQQDIASLNQTLDNLNNENHRLTRNLNILGVELEVQRQANKQAQQTIEAGLQRESELKRELGFYQKVMAPELNLEGFVIDGFEVEKALSDNLYRFQVILMQHEKIKNVVKGNIRIQLSGSENGKPKTYNLATLLPQDSPEMVFSFKYFQVIEGQFEVPEGFVPEQVRVEAEVFQFRRKKGDLERTFDWIINPD